MDETEYQLECGLCDTTTIVVVIEVDEKPIFCPMCGEDLQSE